MNILMGKGAGEFDRSLEYYLAGPMTGLPEYNFPAFDKAAKELREAHIKVQSPHEIVFDEPTPGGLPRAVYLRADFRLMLDCQGVILLPGWHKSPGAVAEVNVAHWLEMPTYLHGDGYLILMSGGRGERCLGA